MLRQYKKLSILLLVSWLIFTISIRGFKYKGSFKKDKENSKIILIGLDGAEWNIIDKLIEQDKLPNFAKLIKNGAYGDLRSIFPIISPPIWVSIITGKSREKHGITDFFIKYFGQYESIPVTSHRKAKALWNIFSENNKSVGIINWWSSWPAEKVKGWIVSNYPFCVTVNIIDEKRLLESVKKSKITYPESITKDIISIADVPEDAVKKVGEFILGRPLSNLDINSEKEKNFIKILFAGVKTEMGLRDIGKYLMKKISPDFFAIYFKALDGVQHVFWHYMDYNAPWEFKINRDEIERFGEIIYNCYQVFDKTIGELLVDIDKNTTVIIVSDHGFRANTEVKEMNYSLNFIFEKLGWLKYKDEDSGEIDWSKTKVYDFNPNIWNPRRDLYINLKGRDPEGIISRDEFQKFKIRIKEALEKIKTTDGVSLIKECVITETAQSILKGRQPPDLVAILNVSVSYNQNFKILDKTYSVNKIIMPALLSGTHREYGIIIMFGKDIKKGVKIEDATILDIAPTILALAGLPVGKDMDGKVLTDAFEEEFLQKEPIKYISSYERIRPRKIKISKDVLIDEYGEQLKDRLKSLGYIQ